VSNCSKGVTLDIWGTFLHGQPGFSRKRVEVLAEVLDIAFDLDQAVDVYREVAADSDARSIRTGVDIPPLVRLQLFMQECDLPLGLLNERAYREWTERLIYSRTHEHLPLLIEPDFLETLERLRQANYIIGIVSNTGFDGHDMMEQVLERHGVWDYLSAAVFSSQHGMAKPNREIFESAAKQMSLPASRIVHVGDNPVADVLGASGAGMTPVYLYNMPARQEPVVYGVRSVKLLSELQDLLERM
jgi:putative hydrolase of the HAD superfamily